MLVGEMGDDKTASFSHRTMRAFFDLFDGNLVPVICGNHKEHQLPRKDTMFGV